jgi:yeast amino acid transporter
MFYVLGALAIGVIVLSNNPSLLSDGAGAAASPLGRSNPQCWHSSLGLNRERHYPPVCLVGRQLISLPGQPSALFDGNVWQRPCHLHSMHQIRCATIASALFSVLAYLNLGDTSTTVFNWFVNVINAGGFLSWICSTVIYLRFRQAANAQKIEGIPYRSRLQPYTAWISCTGVHHHPTDKRFQGIHRRVLKHINLLIVIHYNTHLFCSLSWPQVHPGQE